MEIEESATNSPDWSYENDIEALELEEKINNIINSLPDKCKQIFLMSRFEGLKYNEIAEKLNISVKTVEAQMSKALKVLRENLKDYLTILIIMCLIN